MVPYGGLTGLVEATTADESEVAISLERMNAIEEIDIASRTMTVQAGVPLQVVQEAAEAEGLLFPLDIGARGSATIGGNVATNAGGNRVIRFGMMRDQILGMEVVLADGTVLSSMNKIIKNNTGYDLKQLFIGSEGTLGIVTRLVLKLRPAPTSQNMAFLAASTFDQVTTLLNQLDAGLGGSLSAFEVMWSDYYELVTKPPATGKPPVAHGYGFYILVEALGGDEDADSERFLAVLSGDGGGDRHDGAIAQSQGERDAKQAIRTMSVKSPNLARLCVRYQRAAQSMNSYVEEMKGFDRKWPSNCAWFSVI